MKTVRLNAKYIKHRIIELDIKNMKTLSEMLGISHNSLSEALLGKNSLLRPKRLAKLTEILQCSIGDILEVVEVVDDD